jgi:hypothetical protein
MAQLSIKENKKGVHTGLKMLESHQSVGTPLSGCEVSSPPLDYKLRTTFAGHQLSEQ